MVKAVSLDFDPPVHQSDNLDGLSGIALRILEVPDLRNNLNKSNIAMVFSSVNFVLKNSDERQRHLPLSSGHPKIQVVSLR